MTRTQTIAISNKKNKLIERLKNLRRNYMAIIYAGVIKGLPQKDIHKQLKDFTLAFSNKGLPTDKNLLQYAYALAKATKKKKTDEELGIFVFKLWNKWDVKGVFDSSIYETARAYEGELKEEVIKQDTPQKGDEKVFYLISEHADCAEDHKKHQGKVYIDQNWRKIAPKDKITEIDAVRQQYKIGIFQTVISKPVWMITRPNCRHYFTRISASEISGRSYKEVIKEQDMYLQVGNRPHMQTYRHPTNKAWYSRQNAEMMVDKYKDRLRIHQDLYAIDKNEFIARAIKKDKLLIKKWENYSRKLK